MIRTHILCCSLAKQEADALNAASAHIYSDVLVTHYRAYRKSGERTRHWLSEYAAKRLNDWRTRNQPPLLHAHSKDAAQEAFYNACKTAKTNRHLGAKYPHKRKRWRPTIWKPSAIRRADGHLVLSRARGLLPIRVALPRDFPQGVVKEVRLVWERVARHYQWHVVVDDQQPAPTAPGTGTVAVDFGEIHPAVCTDGKTALLVTGRALRAHRQYLPKRIASLQAAQARKQKGSRRWWKLQKRKTRVRAMLRRRMRDSEHKISRAIVDYAVASQAGTLAIGDVRDIADAPNKGAKLNQKLSTWTHGRIRQLTTYKAESCGITVVLVPEHYSSQSCPSCGHRTKPTGRVYRCLVCGLVAHRDVVGAVNLLSRDTRGVLGQIPPPSNLKQRRPAAACGKRSMRRSSGPRHVARLPQ